MYDLIIIGAGPAGLTAGLYAGRYKLNTVILEKMSPGGQIIFSPSIDNYPGFPSGVSTQELIDKIKEQVAELGVAIDLDEAIDVLVDNSSEMPVYTVITSQVRYQARCVIVASGAMPKSLGIAREDKFIGRGISYCGTCDGPLYKDKEIIVVGAGDRAIEEAIFLTSYAKSVTVVHRRNELRASRILQDKAFQNPKIKFILDSVVQEIVGKDRLEAVVIKNVKSLAISQLFCQGMFIFVGVKPNTAFLGGLLKVDEGGFIITNEDMHTSLRGVFACGDCRKKSFYQVITACGDAAVAVASAHKYLIENV